MISFRHNGARKALWLSSLLFAFTTVESSLRGALRYAPPAYGRDRQLGMEKSTSSDDKASPALNHEDFGIPSSDSEDKSKDKSNDKTKDKSNDKSKSKDESKEKSKDESKTKSAAKSKGGSSGDSKGGNKGKSGSKGGSKEKKGSKGGSKGDSKGKKGSEAGSKGSKGGNKGKSGAKSSSEDDMGSKGKSKSDSKGSKGSEGGSKGSKGGNKGKSGAKSGSGDDKGSNGKSKSSPAKSKSKSAKRKPTSKPSSEPTSKPTQVPTMRPVPSPTMNPTERVNRQQECDVDSIGSFGVTSSGRQELYFYYQVETIPSATQDLLDSTLLSLVESAVDKLLLASLFASCGETSTRKLHTNHRLQVQELIAASSQRQEPMLAPSDIQGYSSLPIDRVLPGVPCFGSREAPANNCYVIVGGSSLYISEGVDSKAILDRSKGGIKTAMESGTFKRLDGRIVNVTYLEDAFIQDPNTPSVDRSTSPDDDKISSWAWGVAIGAAGGFVLLGLFGFLSMRRRRMDKGSGEMTPLDENVVNASQDSTEQLPQDYSPPTGEDDDDDFTEPLPKDYTLPSGESNDEDSTEPLPQGDTHPSGETDHEDYSNLLTCEDDGDSTLIVN